MLVEMRHKVVEMRRKLYLYIKNAGGMAIASAGIGCTLLAVVAVVMATGDPDIEATVEARIEEKQAEDAALEIKAKAMAKAYG